MKCPHCQTSFHDNKTSGQVTFDENLFWKVEYQDCPACRQAVIEAVAYTTAYNEHGRAIKGQERKRFFIHPKGSLRPNPPASVPAALAVDYIEASLVLADSAKASAALSRRCLQTLIRDVVGIKDKDLAPAIDKLLASNVLPSHLSEAVDAIRNIGNFAAHPIKSTSSGEIIDVEPGEAEWNLDVLDGLFDFYFVQPAILKAKKSALDAKLAEAGKPASK